MLFIISTAEGTLLLVSHILSLCRCQPAVALPAKTNDRIKARGCGSRFEHRLPPLRMHAQGTHMPF